MAPERRPRRSRSCGVAPCRDASCGDGTGKSSGSTRSRARGLHRHEADELTAFGGRLEGIVGKDVDPPLRPRLRLLRVAPDREEVARLVADVDAPVDVAVRVPLAPDHGEVERPDRVVAGEERLDRIPMGIPLRPRPELLDPRLVRAVQEIAAVEEIAEEDPLRLRLVVVDLPALGRRGRAAGRTPPRRLARSSGGACAASPTGFSRLRSSQDSKRLKNAGESAVRGARARAARAGRAAPNRRCRTSRTARRTRWSR